MPPLSALVLSLALAAEPAALAAAPRGTVALTVSGLRGAAGSLRVKLVRSAEGFPGSDEHVVAKRRIDLAEAGAAAEAGAGSGALRLSFEGVPFGEYAVVCLHDADDDAELDRTLVGLPAEGLGFSSGARIRFGPPGFEEARFVLDAAQVELAIEVRY